MSGWVLDASVVISLLSRTDAMHAACRHWFDEARGQASLALPASAYAEVAVGAIRFGDPDCVRLDEVLDAASIEVVPTTREAAVQAARLRASSRALRLPDALILGAAFATSSVAVTTDAAWRRFGAGVVVIG